MCPHPVDHTCPNARKHPIQYDWLQTQQTRQRNISNGTNGNPEENETNSNLIVRPGNSGFTLLAVNAKHSHSVCTSF